MAAIVSQWWHWRRVVNAYEVKGGMVCLKCKNCDPYLSAPEVSSQCGAIEIYLPPLPFHQFVGKSCPRMRRIIIFYCSYTTVDPVERLQGTMGSYCH